MTVTPTPERAQPSTRLSRSVVLPEPVAPKTARWRARVSGERTSEPCLASAMAIPVAASRSRWEPGSARSRSRAKPSKRRSGRAQSAPRSSGSADSGEEPAFEPSRTVQTSDCGPERSASVAATSFHSSAAPAAGSRPDASRATVALYMPLEASVVRDGAGGIGLSATDRMRTASTIAVRTNPPIDRPMPSSPESDDAPGISPMRSTTSARVRAPSSATARRSGTEAASVSVRRD